MVSLALGIVGFLPLFGGPGYEQSLASGLIVPAAAAIATALDLSASDEPALTGFGRAQGFAGVLSAGAFATALVHGLRIGICDLWGGTEFFALTAGVGAAMGAAWGAVVAEVCRWLRLRPWAMVLFALAGPLAGIALSAARFLGSPMIFAFDPFFGFFSGALYDTIVDVDAQLWTYRAGSLATLAGTALVASSLQRGPTRVLRLRRDRPAAARIALGVAALAASLTLASCGPELGHWQTAATIARSLGGRAAGPHCDVIYPDSLLADQVTLLVRDCEEQLEADERRLGTRLDGRLTEYVFRDTNEKRLLVGAAQTSIAKPWRREVYIQAAAYPHPILGHEIAHVVAGSFARGPFRVAGGAGGFWPNPGLIEGIAVAASPDDDELTDTQWARAMLDLGILPPVHRLFSLGFLAENAAKSYTIAGAFVAWVLDRWGTGVVGAWYGGGSIEALTGQSWSGLEDAFQRSLRALAMPAEAAAYARARFERPSVWGRKCPHVIDTLNRDADRCRDDRRFERARQLYSRVLATDPHDWHARFERARIELWFGAAADGRAEFEAIATDDRAPRTWRDRAEEAVADDDLVRGDNDRAASAFRDLAARTLDEDSARTLDVKAQSAESPPARQAVVDLLIGEPGRPVDAWLGALSLGIWSQRASEPLASYLIGKNLTLHAAYARAATWLDNASDAGGLDGPVARELLRQRAICACVLRDSGAVERVRARVEAATSPFAENLGGGRRHWVLALLARCASF